MKPSTIRPCPECGGQRVPVEDHMHGSYPTRALFLVQPMRSRKIFQAKSNSSETLTLTCLQCGYTAWYAVEPSNLIPDG